VSRPRQAQQPSHHICDQGDMDAICGRSSGAGPAVRAGQWLCGQARGVSDAARSDGKSRQVVFGLEDDTSKTRTVPARLVAGLLPAGVYPSPTRRHDTRLARLRLRSAVIASSAIARRMRLVSSGTARRHEFRPSREWRSGGLAPISSTRRRTTWAEELGVGRAAACTALRCQVRLHRRRRSDPTELSADSCGGDGVRRARAADRLSWGRSATPR